MTNWGRMFLVWNQHVTRFVFLKFFLFSLFMIFSNHGWSGYSSHELFQNEKSEEKQLRELRDEEINQLRITLGRRLPSNRMADLYFRLAEVYMEAYRAGFLLEGRAHDQRLEKNIPDRLIDRSYSKPILYKGIKACQDIIKFNIHYSKLDQIYYFLAFYNSELDQKQQSAHYYKELVSKFPKSVFAGVAYKELGDAEYYKHNYKESENYYQHSLPRMEKKSWPPILHKLAWSKYRTKKFDQAISTMKQAVATCSDLSSHHDDRYTPFKSDILRDLASMMTEQGTVEESVDYFEKVAGDEKLLPALLEKLGKEYERNTDLSKAIKTYEALLKLKPDSQEALRVLVKLIELDLDRKSFINAAKKIQKNKFPKIEDSGDLETQASVKNLRIKIRKIATDNHQNYRKMKNFNSEAMNVAKVAELFYKIYLDHFLSVEDDHHEKIEIQMYLAEVKKDLGNIAEATIIYKNVVLSKDPKFVKQAAILWTSTLADLIHKSSNHHSASLQPSHLEKDFIEAADFLKKELKDSQEVKESSLRAAQVLAGYDQSQDEALERIESIIQTWPSSPQSLLAAQLWFQIGQDKKKKNPDSKTLIRAVDKIRNDKALIAFDHQTNQNKISHFIHEFDLSLAVKEIAQKEKSEDFKSAALAYEQYAKDVTDQNRAETAYENAINSYLKFSDFSESNGENIFQVISHWKKRFSKSKRVEESLRMIATRALIQGNFELASKTFEKIGVEYSDPASLETSARIDEGNEQQELAIQKWENYLKIFASHSAKNNKKISSEKVSLQLGKIFEKLQKDSESSHYYKKCEIVENSEYQAECASRLADLYLKNKNEDQAKNIFKKTAQQKSKKQSYFLSYSRFRLAEILEQETHFHPMKLPEAELQKTLNQRLVFLEKLSQAYQSAVSSGGPWAVAALHKLALWVYRFADEVDHVSPSSTFNDKAIANFKKSLTAVSQPLREKSKSAWMDGYKKAVSLEILSPALPEMVDHLADLRVGQPKRAQGPKVTFSLSGMDPNKDSSLLETIRSNLIKNTRDEKSWIDYGNFLSISKKPKLAQLAYEQALAIQPKNPMALNNLAVVMLRIEGQEDWIIVEEAKRLFEKSLQLDSFFVTAKINLGSLYNYYRMFEPAKKLWSQVLVKSQYAEAYEGLAIALQGLGQEKEAISLFQKAQDLGAKSSSFSQKYHLAAQKSVEGNDGADDCYSYLKSIDPQDGFEKDSVVYLKERCEQWAK